MADHTEITKTSLNLHMCTPLAIIVTCVFKQLIRFELNNKFEYLRIIYQIIKNPLYNKMLLYN